MNKNNNKIVKYWAEIIVENNKAKIVKANRLTAINQHKMSWLPYNARNLARTINTSSLVIK